MKIMTTTSVSFTKTEALDALLKVSGIELQDNQSAVVKHLTEPFERFIIYITTKEG